MRPQDASTEDWPAGAVLWHVYPLGFVGAERSAVDHVTHRLGHVARYLEHVAALGADTLLLGPVFASATHGYDTLDYYRIDPRLGDLDDFRSLMRACASLGLRVVLDGVFNHVGRDHEIVRRALEAGPGTQDGDWIKWSGEHPYLFEGHEILVELNLLNPDVQAYVVDVMGYWLDQGIAGWRLDAAYAAGGETWAPIVAAIRQSHPEVWLLAEVTQGDYLSFARASGVDTVTQYELWKSMWSSFNARNLYELGWAIERHADFCEAYRPQTFLGNHDVTRIASLLKDPAHLPMALALLMLLPGTPSIYSGDEFGMTGVKVSGVGGDDALRPAFPPRWSDLGASETVELYRSMIALRRAHPWVADAKVTVPYATDTGLLVQIEDAGHRLVVGLNIGDEEASLPWDVPVLKVPARSWILQE